MNIRGLCKDMTIVLNDQDFLSNGTMNCISLADDKIIAIFIKIIYMF